MGKTEKCLKFYEEKDKGYFSGIRWDIIKLFPPINNAKVLEIGAGEGNTLIKLKELGLAKEVVGVDLIQLPNSNQTHPKIDKFIIGDIESIDLSFFEEYFDIIICADVLEHLYDPWRTIDKIIFCLRPKGFLIISLPNVGHYSVLKRIIIDKNFKYEEQGILDKTHLRFFCRKNIIDLFPNPNFKILRFIPNFELNRYFKGFINNISLNFSLEDLKKAGYQ
ncbi:MAG: class I SAM-dependent methyltransferase [Dictyoglomus sp.]|nr:class I SAM-dependent methyltransferase [Dictyoglomus sp.]MDW8189311.1 class I SAM-dependent methyltransferase [Dictyoglomus sp.]